MLRKLWLNINQLSGEERVKNQLMEVVILNLAEARAGFVRGIFFLR